MINSFGVSAETLGRAVLTHRLRMSCLTVSLLRAAWLKQRQETAPDDKHHVSYLSMETINRSNIWWKPGLLFSLQTTLRGHWTPVQNSIILLRVPVPCKFHHQSPFPCTTLFFAHSSMCKENKTFPERKTNGCSLQWDHLSQTNHGQGICKFCMKWQWQFWNSWSASKIISGLYLIILIVKRSPGSPGTYLNWQGKHVRARNDWYVYIMCNFCW